MKLASLADDSRDGRLAVVSRDLTRLLEAGGIARTMQEALENWNNVLAPLNALSDRLNAGEGACFAPEHALAPLPRAWQWLDASAFPSHGALMDRVFGVSAKKYDAPLMYQGLSHQFHSGTQTISFNDVDDGIDFEGEVAVILGETPRGADVAEAEKRIHLIGLVNDWSLRKIAPIEMATGFGWILAKPPCSMAPVAVTPDELGASWRDGRIQLRLKVWRNSEIFGQAHAGAMEFSFPELIRHAARTRSLCAGTILGSGTVSNEDFRVVGSSCIAERRGVELEDSGLAKTHYMSDGERVTMEMLDAQGISLFGRIDQAVSTVAG
ncbi:fumarylacetoacetate hydrolase [Bradyrhizobium canariense]|uniref:fumarylacetoacetate hydrolase family protein n=1 Tax=Bradyrhizobium canariense TaxID=255045 RepID=UPI001CA5F370|nr:fumarylacetoacetate hydrolase family protein [Bradyrhizobium canariense]MBW5440500.1 fumarylacetoacetate hydrolase [Bradyrhizobium canariense]